MALARPPWARCALHLAKRTPGALRAARAAFRGRPFAAPCFGAPSKLRVSAPRCRLWKDERFPVLWRPHGPGGAPRAPGPSQRGLCAAATAQYAALAARAPAVQAGSQHRPDLLLQGQGGEVNGRAGGRAGRGGRAEEANKKPRPASHLRRRAREAAQVSRSLAAGLSTQCRARKSPTAVTAVG